MAFVAMPLCLIGLFLLVQHWPFNRDAVVKELEETSMSQVDVEAFHKTYFPRPGCVLEHVIFRHNHRPGSPPLMTVSSTRIEGSFAELLSRRIQRIVVEGMRILIPSLGSGERFETPARVNLVIDELIANGTVLDAFCVQGESRSPTPELRSQWGRG